MRHFITAALIATALLAALPARIEAGVSISIGDPHFYGRIDIGGYPPPRLIYEQPVIVRRVRVWHPPIYLRVPMMHRESWYRYCDQYDACGRPVYFVDDGWYEDVYAPRYREVRPIPRVYYRPLPPPPVYYEYRYDHRRAPKKVYIKDVPPGHHHRPHHKDKWHR